MPFGNNFCMEKSQFARFCDTVLFVLGIGIISFAWLNKYVKNTFVSLLITCLMSLVIGQLIWRIFTLNNNRKKLRSQELKFAQNCIDWLSLNPEKCLDFFAKLFENCKIEDGYIIYQNSIHYFDYSNDETTIKTIAKLNKLSENYDKIYLYSSKLSSKASKLIVQTNICHIIDYDCYLFMKEKNMFPISENRNQKIQKRKIKQTFLSLIERKKAKPYFLYGTLLLFSSFFMPYSFLYCAIGTLSIILALVCVVVRNTPKQNLS